MEDRESALQTHIELIESQRDALKLQLNAYTESSASFLRVYTRLHNCFSVHAVFHVALVLADTPLLNYI